MYMYIVHVHVCIHLHVYMYNTCRYYCNVFSPPLLLCSSEFVDTGTILFISSLEYTPDGRSLVTTLGEKRFRVCDRRSTDGYYTARIRFVLDEAVEGSDAIGTHTHTHTHTHTKLIL